jgi:adenine-specific DNA-methyltransferase
MAHIDDLVNQVSDPQLRAALMQQVSTLTSRKQFGLVFQEHSPESVRLPQQRVRTGDKVHLRESKDSATFHVISTKAALDVATVVEIDESGETVGEPKDILKAGLVVVKPFGDPVFPGLRQVGEAGSTKTGHPTHVVINGENYHALQALEYTHAGKVDLIYIDPPYNTGAADWKYNDKYIDGNDSYRHSKWLSFMEKRLNIAKLLLKETGVIAISIGDDEYHRLRMLADQVFGESCFLGSIARKAGNGGRQHKHIKKTLDYVLVYGRTSQTPTFTVPMSEKQLSKYKQEDEQGRYCTEVLYMAALDPVGRRMRYWIQCPDGSFCIPPGTTFPAVVEGEAIVSKSASEKRWRWAPDTFRAKRDQLVFKQTKTSPLLDENGNQSKWNVYAKQYLGEEAGIQPLDYWDDVSNALGTKRLMDIGLEFPYAKPVELIDRLARMINNPNAVIVDFFAGSGTTAEAVIRLNEEDAGSRQAILITNNELSKKEDADLRKAGLRPGDEEYEAMGVFHHVTMPRLKTVLSGIRKDGSKYSEGIDGQSAAFFDLTYEDENLISLGNKFEAVAPLLWMQSGAKGELIAKRSDLSKGDDGYSVPHDGNYAVIFDTEAAADAIAVLHDGINKVFIVTDSENDFRAVTANLPGNLRNNAQRLYSSYLRSFEINRG